MTTTAHQPGDFFVVRTTGIFARAICVACNSTVNHAGVYVGDGLIVEAEPGKNGARYNKAENYADALWSTHNLPAHLTPTDAQLAQIAQEAVGCLGTPYGLWTIVVIAFTQRAGWSLCSAQGRRSTGPAFVTSTTNSKRSASKRPVALLEQMLHGEDR